MNIDLILIKLLFDYNNYQKFNRYINKETTSKELTRLYSCLDLFHEKFPHQNVASANDLEAFYYANYPVASQRDKEAISALFQKVQATEISALVAEDLLERHSQRAKAHQLALLAIEVADGKQDFSSLCEAASGLGSGAEDIRGDEFVTTNLEEIYERNYATSGIRWRLATLNSMLGSLRRGDFGFLFARPESGKTTFLASEATFFATQVDRPILWFNNEQPGEVVQARIIQAHFGVTTNELFKNRTDYSARYRAAFNSTIRVYDSGSIHRRDVDRLCSNLSPSLIIFDQIDKIKGFKDDRNDIELGEIYQWARELAKRYGPVIGVCQAGGTAEGKKWLTMDDVNNSKTSKQGEADWILGIGKTTGEGLENIRHFHLCKNKLIGDIDTIPELRHGKVDVLIKPQIARYEDLPK